ncbi:MAG TPA: T9SS type A sorting domain-containing protein [Chitinophagaceae bacterium]|nr:T9SS type A sorting domain-containing protein [Chitinophagaceae bacterium]
MKTIFTLLTLVFTTTFSNAQVVLNEVYTDPGNGKHEFFEFYNVSSTTQNMDNFTIITYYTEPGNKSGFYVMDLPNQNVFAKGFYIGASVNPFNVQGQTNLVADFNWNAMPAGGALTKWEKDGSGYIQRTVPANLNDFIVTVTGSGAVHHMFIYKDGALVNSLITGTNFAVMPSYIKAMPDLPVNMVSSSPFSFTAVFSTLADNKAEYVNSAAGNDNGYIRSGDGKCGVWIKSTTQVQHTPGLSNGSATGISGDATISASITEYNPDPSKSLLTYNVTAGTLSSFPLTIEAYQDLGTIGGLGASDVLVDSRIITNVSAGNQTVVMPTRNDPVMLVAITPSGCFDRVMAVNNNLSALSTLPVKLTSFTANLKNTNVELAWTTVEEKNFNLFEVERSFDGADYKTISLVFANGSTNSKTNYSYTDNVKDIAKSIIYYRLKMVDIDGSFKYSDVRVIRIGEQTETAKIITYPNPAVNEVRVTIPASWQNKEVKYEIFNTNGQLVKVKMNANASQTEALDLSTMARGMYIVKLTKGTETAQQKIIKN